MAAAGFIINAPKLLTCEIGKSTTAAVTVTRSGRGKNRRVALWATVPSGITVGFQPIAGMPTYASQMNVTLSPSLAPGDYIIDVKGAV